MDPVTVRSLIFDLDGTLVDSCEDIAASLNYTLATLGLPTKTRAEVERFVGDGVKILLTRAAGNSDPAFLEKAVQIFRPHYSEHCVDRTELYPDVKEILENFKNKKLGVVSNKPFEMVIKTLDHFRVRHYFQSVMGAESTPNRKPHPEPVLKTLEILKATKSDAVMVGDGTADIAAGKAAGVLTCAVTYGYRKREELEAAKPNFIIKSILELKNLIH